MNIGTRRKKFILNANFGDYEEAKHHLEKYYEALIDWNKRHRYNYTLDQLVGKMDKSFIKKFDEDYKKFMENNGKKENKKIE